MDDELIPVETEKPPKERVKLTHSFWAKVGAVVLLYVFLLGLAICVACFAANVAGWGDAEYVQKYVINELDFTDPSAMTLTRIIWNVSTFCGASAYVGTLCILLALACLIFLFCAAGHRKRETEPRLNQLDRIPLDLYAAAVVGACILLIFVIGDVLRWNMPSGYAAIMQMVFIFAFIGCASFGLVLALLLSFATRVKCGKWWRNTVIYCVLRLIWRAVKAVWHGIGRIGRMIPIVWRTALIMLGLYIIGFILFILMYDESGGWLLVGLLFSIVIYAAAIFGAWQMKGIKKAGQQLAEGKFDEKIDTKHMYWEFKSHAENLNSIGDGLAKEVAQRMKSERLKTCLLYTSTFKPDVAAIEELFFNTNITTGISVAQGRGVILLACYHAGLPVFEYTPLQVKQAVVGYGRAEKSQVIDMVKRILSLKSAPKPDDAADAVAIALCHARSSTSLMAGMTGGNVCSTI